MNRKPVASSNVVSVGYDQLTETLEVEFMNGAVYQYYNVPESVYDALLSAPSAGRFLASQVKNAFPYSRVG